MFLLLFIPAVFGSTPSSCITTEEGCLWFLLHSESEVPEIVK